MHYSQKVSLMQNILPHKKRILVNINEVFLFILLEQET
ncbi:hypothetical protein BAOM_2253 [Peribacillus asahii]|uniref:Uncharacterized protein n=1 Tax=Peribacillus asahii TaxID=228899 RepID=A0A3Q9RMV5_9BACI|nr:hypothetical protein BAOM_2253 [Peribacillus asahii]